MGGPKLYGPGGFWDRVGWGSFYRVRPTVRLAAVLLGVSFAVFALPLLLGLLLGLLFPLLLIADRVWPGSTSALMTRLWTAPETLSGPYLAAQAVPVFALALLALVGIAVVFLRDRRRVAEAFESILDVKPGLERLRGGLWELARGAALRTVPQSDPELGRRFVALLGENIGQPGFRELVLRAADLDRGGALAFSALRDRMPETGGRRHGDALAETVDLAVAGTDTLFFDAVATGLHVPFAVPLRRVTFPRGGPHPGETHRLLDATLAGGAGIAEAAAAGAEQVIVATAVPEIEAPLARRRGPRARVDAALRLLERQAAGEIDAVERLNRVIATLGHRKADGRKAWEDPTTGQEHRELDLWVIRPARRAVGPFELDGAQDPATEVLETLPDLLEQGYRDAFQQFVEPVVGASPLPEREEGKHRDTQPIGL
jgi:hypothetical protein